MNRVANSDKDTRRDLESLPIHVLLTTESPTYQMKASDNVMSFVSSASDDVAIVTLPPVGEAVGQHYYIVAPTGNTGGDISLYEKETGSEYTGGGDDGDLDTDADHVILFSTGTAWLTRLDGVA